MVLYKSWGAENGLSQVQAIRECTVGRDFINNDKTDYSNKTD